MNFLVEEEKVDKYKFIRFLGKGSFGQAELVEKDGKKYVKKTVPRTKENWNKYKNEQIVLEYIKKNCSPYFLCFQEFQSDDTKLIIYADYKENTVPLDTYIKGRKRLDLNPLNFLFVSRSLLKGLKLLHSMGVIHRDIKPGNILINKKTGLCNYIDFGTACLDFENEFVKSSVSNFNNENCKVNIATPLYVDPRILKGEIEEFSDLYGTDVWSLGMTLYEFAFGILPFKDHSVVMGLEPEQVIFRTNKTIATLDTKTMNFLENNINMDDLNEKYNFREFQVFRDVCIQLIKLCLNSKKSIDSILKILEATILNYNISSNSIFKAPKGTEDIEYKIIKNKNPATRTIALGTKKELKRFEDYLKKENPNQSKNLRRLRAIFDLTKEEKGGKGDERKLSEYELATYLKSPSSVWRRRYRTLLEEQPNRNDFFPIRKRQ